MTTIPSYIQWRIPSFNRVTKYSTVHRCRGTVTLCGLSVPMDRVERHAGTYCKRCAAAWLRETAR